MRSHSFLSNKPHKNTGTHKRPILEMLEDRMAPGDLLGLGLTQAAISSVGTKGLVSPLTAPSLTTPSALNSNSASHLASQRSPVASSAFPTVQTPARQSANSQSPTNPTIFAFPQPNFEGFPESRSSFPSISSNSPASSVMGTTPTPIGMPSIGNPVGINPSQGSTPIGSPITPVQVVTPPPTVPTAVSFTGISPDTGSSATDAVTTAQRPMILGKATPGSVVTVSENGVTLGTGQANLGGLFSVPVNQFLSDGVHGLVITAQKAGMDSGTSRASVTVDTKAPQITLAAPASVTNGKAPIITATSSEGGTVAIDVDINLDGNFTGSELSFALARSGQPTTLPGMPAWGDFKIRARQSDIAGNAGSAETSTMIDQNAGFVGDSQLRTMVQPVLRDLGIGQRWDGKAVNIPANYSPANPKLTERVNISTRCVSPRQFEAFKAGLSRLGMNIVATENRDLLADGSIPLYKVLALPSVEGFSSASYAPKALTRAGSVQNQGVPVMGIPSFIQRTGSNGQGVTIGVISDSANAVTPGIAGSISTGDLPVNTTVLFDNPTGSDEGRAMMEVAYDAAPGSSMAFSAGGPSPVTFANSITNLANFGCKVITDDLVFLNMPLFNDGRVSQAAQTAVNNGVVYTSAFGNQGDWGWQAAWSPVQGSIGSGNSAVSGTFMNLGGGDFLQNLTLSTGSILNLAFTWNSAYLEGGSSLANYQVNNNLDVFLVDLGSGNIVASSTSINPNTDMAWELLGYQNTSASTSYALAFQLVSGNAPTRLAWINYGDSNVQAQGQGATTSQGTATVPGVIAVAAANASTPQTPESFTSLGGQLPFYYDTFTGAPLATPQIRQKPDITAPDGISTTLSPNSGLNPFFGTSCAAPQVAAASALLLSSKPSATNSQVFFQLVSNAAKIYPAGSQNLVGAGMTTVVPFNVATPPDPSGDPLFPAMLGTVGQTVVTLQNHSITNQGSIADIDWFALRPASNGQLNVSMFNGPGGSLELRLYTLGTNLNMVERARSITPGLTNRNLSISVTANQFVYVMVKGRAQGNGLTDQAFYNLSVNMS